MQGSDEEEGASFIKVLFRVELHFTIKRDDFLLSGLDSGFSEHRPSVPVPFVSYQVEVTLHVAIKGIGSPLHTGCSGSSSPKPGFSS